MSDFSPSEKVKAELVVVLKRRYPELHQEESEIKSEAERVYLSIDYPKRHCASVNFIQGQKSWPADFEYREKSPPNNREFHWYCLRDWKD